MSSRSGSHSRRQRSREPNNEDYPSLPAPRLPPLRILTAQRDRDSTSPLSTSRPSRYWSAAAARRAERAERIRNLDAADSNMSSEFQRVLDQAWGGDPRSERAHSSDSTRPSNLDDLDRSLDEANSHLRMLLEMTNHSNLASTLAPPSNSPPPHRTSDLTDDSRRSKRRKLDSERLAPKPAPFRYGKYGQVEAGQLRMEMASCDGGMFSNEKSYAAENILKNDGSVYCTKGNRCNIVLRHQGNTAFTLSELVIKGPTSMNYSHPIREGMVFVAMHQDEILNRTARHQIQYAHVAREPSWTLQASEDQEHPRHALSIRHNDDGTTSTRLRRSLVYRADDDAYRVAQMPPEFSSTQSPAGVYIECSDDDDDGEGNTRRYSLAPNRIGALPFENLDSDDDEELNSPGYDFEDLSLGFGPDRSSNDYSSMSLNELSEASTHATQEAVRAVGGEMLAPHARFFIEKKKSTCTIRFDPPVSGRYILLKMWNSHHDPSSNIDIQSVIAKGFAGPRYFPAVELR